MEKKSEITKATPQHTAEAATENGFLPIQQQRIAKINLLEH